MPAPAAQLMLFIEGLTKTYPNGVRALDNVTLEIPKGMFGLLGPNGAGKSTLMRTLATLQGADSGSATFDGIEVLKQPEEIRKTLGYLPQDFGVYPRISALHMLEHLAVLKGVPANQRKEVVESLLRQTNLWDVRKKALAGYSGGMRQRFGIAQALLGDPRLIIVDEPTAGLDPEERQRFHNLLTEIGQNVIVILSTHIVEDVADLCPRMAVMNKGRIVVEGAPRELVAGLEGQVYEAKVSKEEVDALRQRYDVLSTRLSDGQVEVRVRASSDPGEGFEPRPAVLEDVYFANITRPSANQTA